MEFPASIENSFFQIFSKVDDRVFELTTAAWGITNAASQVRFVANRCLVVTHVLSIALYAEFEVSVSMQLSHQVSSDATFAMKTINVLADDTLEDASILKLDKSHVSL